VQHRGAHDLDIEVAHVQRPLAGLADARERLRQEVVEVLAVLVTLAELLGLRPELLVREGGDRLLPGGDLGDDSLELSPGLALAGAEHLVEQLGHGAGDSFSLQEGARARGPVSENGSSRRVVPGARRRAHLVAPAGAAISWRTQYEHSPPTS
jgi:hypothetical protein